MGDYVDNPADFYWKQLIDELTNMRAENEAYADQLEQRMKELQAYISVIANALDDIAHRVCEQ